MCTQEVSKDQEGIVNNVKTPTTSIVKVRRRYLLSWKLCIFSNALNATYWYWRHYANCLLNSVIFVSTSVFKISCSKWEHKDDSKCRTSRYVDVTYIVKIICQQLIDTFTSLKMVFTKEYCEFESEGKYCFKDRTF